MCTVENLWVSEPSLSKLENFQCSSALLTLLNIKYNCAVLFLSQLCWLFIYASKNISSLTSILKPSQIFFVISLKKTEFMKTYQIDWSSIKMSMLHINKLWITSKCIEVYLESRTSVKRASWLQSNSRPCHNQNKIAIIDSKRIYCRTIRIYDISFNVGSLDRFHICVTRWTVITYLIHVGKSFDHFFFHCSSWLIKVNYLFTLWYPHLFQIWYC